MQTQGKHTMSGLSPLTSNIIGKMSIEVICLNGHLYLKDNQCIKHTFTQSLGCPLLTVFTVYENKIAINIIIIILTNLDGDHCILVTELGVSRYPIGS